MGNSVSKGSGRLGKRGCHAAAALVPHRTASGVALGWTPRAVARARPGPVRSPGAGGATRSKAGRFRVPARMRGCRRQASEGRFGGPAYVTAILFSSTKDVNKGRRVLMTLPSLLRRHDRACETPQGG